MSNHQERARRRIAHIQRYMFEWSRNSREGDLAMHECSTGAWIKYDDLLQEIESLLREASTNDAAGKQV